MKERKENLEWITNLCQREAVTSCGPHQQTVVSHQQSCQIFASSCHLDISKKINVKVHTEKTCFEHKIVQGFETHLTRKNELRSYAYHSV
jgi:hypothetical protein